MWVCSASPPHVAERSIDCRATATIIWGLVPDRIADKPTSHTSSLQVAGSIGTLILLLVLFFSFFPAFLVLLPPLLVLLVVLDGFGPFDDDHHHKSVP